MSPMTYPTRCRIIDIEGMALGDGWVAKTPDVSKPKVGKEGLAELVANPDSPFGEDVRITLDDGSIIWGYECWWEPIEDK